MNNRILASLAAVAALAFPVLGQVQDNTQPTLNCQNDNSGNRLVRHCEMREQTIAYAGQLTIDGGRNGGVTVKGWSRADVLVRSKVEASAISDSDARALASQIRVSSSAGRVASEGPASSQDQNWSVSYEVFVPHQANLQVSAHNGGIHINDINGRVDFNTQNGGVHLARLGGHVQGKTTNGGLHIDLMGNRWEGEGMDVSTTNGGVHLGVPANYSARLEMSTVNGSLHSAVPLNVSGKISRQLSTNLGSGGAMIRVATTNGGVHIDQL
jgi:DUF4097 and DUF4098 domain-containing protein YvlB